MLTLHSRHYNIFLDEAYVAIKKKYVLIFFFRPVLPSVQPGYMRDLIPGEAPEEPETWQDFMKDMETIIMPGVSTITIIILSKSI